MRKCKQLAVLAAGAALALSLAVPVGAAGTVLAPQQTAGFSQNSETKIDFTIDQAVAFAGFQVQVQYNAAQLEPIRVEAGSKYKPMSLSSNLEALKQKNEGEQLLSIVAAAPGNASLEAGNTVFSVTFKAKNQAELKIPIQVKSVKLMGADLKALPDVTGGSAEYGTGQLKPAEGSDLHREDNLPPDAEPGVSAYITGISPDLTMDQVLEQLSTGSAQVTVTPSPNKPESQKAMPATGDKITSGSDTVVLVVRGDVNGDASITVGDMVELQRHLQGANLLTGAYFQAASLTEKTSPELSVGDMVEIQRHLLGRQPL